MIDFFVFLHQENNGAATLVGVFSWGKKCRDTNAPGIYSGIQPACLTILALYHDAYMYVLSLVH